MYWVLTPNAAMITRSMSAVDPLVWVSVLTGPAAEASAAKLVYGEEGDDMTTTGMGAVAPMMASLLGSNVIPETPAAFSLTSSTRLSHPMVRPLGDAEARVFWPTMVLPAGMLVMLTVAPRYWARAGASVRAQLSNPPPGLSGAMNVIVLFLKEAFPAETEPVEPLEVVGVLLDEVLLDEPQAAATSETAAITTTHRNPRAARFPRDRGSLRRTDSLTGSDICGFPPVLGAPTGALVM